MPVLGAPGYMVAAVVAATWVVALHLLAWRRPQPSPLPTARFAPPSTVRAVSRHVRLTDVLVLFLRVAALLLAGLALARPAFAPRRAGSARVLLLDASRRVASMDALRDSARRYEAGIDQVTRIRVDSVARLLADTVVGERAAVRGNLSAGMVAAVREATRLSRAHEQVDIVVVSPFAAESWDAATDPVRREWSGRVTAVRLEARGEPSPAAGSSASRVGARVRELPAPTDPVGAAFALAIDSTVPALRVLRDAPAAADSTFANAGGVLVWWPVDTTLSSASENPATPPTAELLLTDGERSAVGRFRPMAEPPLAGTALLRWGDGRIAATESPLGRGCVRAVSVGVPGTGDAVLRPAFVRLVRQLARPCGGGSSAVLDDATLATWAAAPSSAGAGVGADAGGAASPTAGAPDGEGADDTSSGAPRWLLLGAAMALLAEWWLRSRRQDADRAMSATPARAREAA